MWMLHDHVRTRGEWTTADIKLVGIEHHWVRCETVLIGTKIHVIFKGMYPAFPRLQEALRDMFVLHR
jgi:hypothetical protein